MKKNVTVLIVMGIIIIVGIVGEFFMVDHIVNHWNRESNWYRGYAWTVILTTIGFGIIALVGGTGIINQIRKIKSRSYPNYCQDHTTY